MSFTTPHTASGGSHRVDAPGGGPVVALASPAATSAVLLLTAPALLWGMILLASIALGGPGLGSLGDTVVVVLGVASIVGLVGAAGVALTSRLAARRLARISGRPGRRAPTLAIGLVVTGGMLVAGAITFAASAAEQQIVPAAEMLAAPAEAPAEPAAPLFSVDHSGH